MTRNFAGNNSYRRNRAAILCALVGAALIFLDVQRNAFQGVRTSLVGITEVVNQVVGQPKVWIDQVTDLFLSKRQLIEEIEQLKKDQLLDYSRLQQFDALEHRLESLEALVEIRAKYTRSTRIVELAIPSLTPNNHTMVVQSGEDHVLHAGDYVVDRGGLVGQIMSVENEMAMTRLISDRDSRVHVQSVKNDIKGVAFGSGEKNRLELRFVSKDAAIEVGDLFVTSGLGGRHPYGVPVGRVASIDVVRYPDFLSVELRPIASLGSGEFYVVLTGPIGDDVFLSPDHSRD